jgi:endonuclease-3
VDTHVHRVSKRVGLIGPTVSAKKAHTLLFDLLPHDPHTLYNFHITMLLHGQQVCVWRSPRCEQCELPSICNWYQEHRAGPDDA